MALAPGQKNKMRRPAFVRPASTPPPAPRARSARRENRFCFGLEHALGWIFETLGDTSMLLSRDGAPFLAADPWLSGSACFGSWARERDLAPGSVKSVLRAPYVFLSRAADGRTHLPSLRAIGTGCDILLPGNFDPAMRARLAAEGFATRALPRKSWFEIAAGLKLMCVDSDYGAVLAIDAGGLLILNKNDAPFRGAERFFRKLARGYKRSCLLALPEPAFGPDKRRAVQEIGSLCDRLGVTHYAASSPHVHAREDSRWADAGRVTGDDIVLYWSAQAGTFEPCAKIALAMPASAASPCFVAPSAESLPQGTGEDDWSDRLSAAEWFRLDCFVKGAKAFRRGLDFVAFNVGGETRRIRIRRGVKHPLGRQRGLVFSAPRRSLIEAVAGHRFGELLDANFVKLELVNLEDYPLGFFRRVTSGGFRPGPGAWPGAVKELLTIARPPRNRIL